ncbi:ABC transporter ATP-binding protein [Jiella pacifica]|uniref:ATP-binding cassette domain-containing protein n=1 Tax=Jiella pacifica TaxID=2696469 RepID=A0A6N9SVL5_9HYPH|nr:ATP-binding cassette domain-containing protein [Jiella pacifica]NDW03100.1 ATP-binding cassette domain-containing protein [Jiella pacifica]
MSAAEARGVSLDLQVRDLVVRSREGRDLLTVARLDVPAGSKIGIRGPSGAGKSTLLFAIAGLLKPASGDVSWGEHRISDMRAAERARFRRENVGLVFQDFLLFEELSSLGNAAIAARYAKASTRRSIVASARAGLARLGLESLGGRRVDSFSGGERQRVAVARALANDPAIILADEPTASLDRASADRMVDDLASLASESGRTLVAVSHDPALHERMDWVIDVVDGRPLV